MTAPAAAEPRPGSRLARLQTPMTKQILQELARTYGICLHPLVLRRTDIVTGETEILEVPCGARLASRCAPCAERNRRLRIQQIRDGWHLNEEPIPAPRNGTHSERALVALRADLEWQRAAAEHAGQWDQVSDLDAAIAEVDDEIREAGLRGAAGPTTTDGRMPTPRKARTTRRREDAPELPVLTVDRGRTVGRAFKALDGTLHRPSMLVTLTLGSYGAVHSARRPGRPACDCGVLHHPDDPTVGTPLNLDTYDYRRAALDAIHGAKVIDRFWQNLRRATGVNVQYAGSVELQRRLAPHWHFAVRGTFPRRLIQQVAAATYHQVWWPTHDTPIYRPDAAPIWDPNIASYIDRETGEILPTWDEAMASLDAMGEDAAPAHVVWLGKVDARGVNSGTKDAEKTIRYVTKYITKDLTAAADSRGDTSRAHFDRLHAELTYLPCTPGCPNWLLYGVQPAGANGKEKRPGLCRGKVHRRETLGFTGRRVLISRQWSNKTLRDLRDDNKAWVRALLATDDDGPEDDDGVEPRRYAYELARDGDPDVPPIRIRLMRAISTRNQWRRALDQAQQRRDQLSAAEYQVK
jgi:hypothetical protein